MIELGAGNGELMKGIINTIKNFPNMHDCCNFIIHEKSKKLIDVQKKILHLKNYLGKIS